MEACLHIGRRNNGWVRELFPGKSPGELTIAGKNWVRHSLDLCLALDINAVHIADGFASDDLKNRMGHEKFWLSSIDFLPEAEDALRPEELVARHEKALPQDELLFFWGQVLPDLPEPKRLFDDLQAVGAQQNREPLEDGIYLLRGGTLYRCVCPLLRMDSLKSYFSLNFRMLDEPGMYVLPGYDPERNNINFGENVIMMPGCRIASPAVLGNNSMLGRSVALNGHVIVGESSLIESYSLLKNAIIMDFTCVGRRVSIENKIVSGHRVIDVETAAYVDLTDEFLARSARARHFSFYSVAEFLIALALAIGLAPLYLAALLFKSIARKLPFFRFLLHVYPKCLRVLAGRAQLVRIGTGDRDYAFRFSDSQLAFSDPHQRDMADVYYLNHRGTRLMLTTVFLSLVKRLFVISLPDERGV